MNPFAGRALALALVACGCVHPTILPGTSPATVIHQEGRLVCTGDLGSPIDWSRADVTRLRQDVVEAMVRDTVTDAENGLNDPRWWCVLTDTTGWHVPPGVRVTPLPPVETIRRRHDCRQMEIDPVMPVWEGCTFDGRPVQVITFHVSWCPLAGELQSGDHEQRGIDASSTYGAVRDPAGGRPSLILIAQDEF